MAEFRVTASELNAKAEALMELNTSLRGQVTTLEESEGALVGSWIGQARDAFDGQFKLDRGKMEDFSKLIDLYVEKLKEIAAKYSAAEEASRELADTRTYH